LFQLGGFHVTHVEPNARIETFPLEPALNAARDLEDSGQMVIATDEELDATAWN